MTDIKTVQHEDFWKDRPPFIAEVNPLKRDELKKILKRVGLIILFALSWLFVSGQYIEPKLKKGQIELNNDTIKPEMLKLANSGKPQAAIWMAVNYPETDGYRLDQLIAQKDPIAMLAKADMLKKNDPELAKKYIEAAAIEGNPAAVKYLSKKDPDDIGLIQFLTKYVFK